MYNSFKLINMKIIIAILLMFITLVAHDLIDSPHNFSSSDSNDKLCIMCHTPSFNENKKNMTIENSTLLCLSCHDGVNASNETVNSDHWNKNIIGNLNFSEMRKNHPVSVEYNVNGKNSLKNLNTPLPGDWGEDKVVGDLLKGPNKNMVECTSCHNPHKVRSDIKEVNFLRHSNAKSTLCFACHDK